MRCKCGKFMRHDTISIYPNHYTNVWNCVCGKRRTITKKTKPLFHRDAIALVQWR